MGEEKTNSNDHHQLDMYYRLDTNHKAKFAIKYIEEQLAKKQELCELKSSRRKALNQYFSDNPHTAEKQKKEIEKRFTVNSMRSLRFLRRKMTIEEFRSICVIGRGANSEVRLVRRKDSKEVFAMKILEKQEMIARGQIYQVLNELKVMKLANSAVEKLIFPKGIHELSQLTQFGSSKDAVEDKVKSQLHFPILHYAFQDLKNLYFVMEFLPGGDLVSVLMKYDVLNEDQCRFYIAETALAINYLHSLGFVHRDIKPDNILLDKFGHVRLADFGSCVKFKIGEAKKSNEAYPLLFADDDNDSIVENEFIYDPSNSSERRMTSIVGNPDYIAPEVIDSDGIGYGKEVDFWSLGAILYECLVGKPPFYTDDPNPIVTYQKILDWNTSFQIPQEKSISPEARDLLSKLLCNASERISFEELQAHPFFKSIDWQKIKSSDTPIIPRIESEIDVQNFEEFNEIFMTTLPDIQAYTNKIPPSEIVFSSFEYSRPEVSFTSNISDLFYLSKPSISSTPSASPLPKQHFSNPNPS